MDPFVFAAVLFVTHDDDFAERIPHRVLAIGDAQVKAS